MAVHSERLTTHRLQLCRLAFQLIVRQTSKAQYITQQITHSHTHTHTLVVTVTDACLMQTHTVPHALLSCSVPLAAAAGGAARGRPSSPCGRVGWRGGQTGQTHTLLPGRYQPGTGRGYSGKQA